MEQVLPPLPPPKPRRVPVPYVPALGPGLRVLLFVIFGGFALLGATGFYLMAIRVTEWVQQRRDTLHTQFSLWMTLVHVLAGLVLIAPFLIFGITHLVTARHRPNRVAVRLGILVFTFGLIVCASGVLLVQLEGLPQLTTGTVYYWVVYGLHVAIPVAAVFAYVRHRQAGPRIQWKWGYTWGIAVVLFTAIMLVMHAQNPQSWFAQGSREGEYYFEPSRARTSDGKFISAESLMMDEYCLKCHQDVYNNHLHSAHKFSSFNNPAYLFSVRETRRAAGVRASRWCAGCHDPIPFFSGEFDKEDFDDSAKNPLAQAGITCTVCHSITNINSRSGNGDYTIEEPQHYPFAYSENGTLQWLNNQLVKAKPDFHKKTFLKPFHKTEEFCSTCHKVGLPQEVNHYKEFLRGQNHNDSYLLSGVSGHGARSFYYPPVAKTNCADCHMPLMESNDRGARDFDGSGKLKVHDHTFPGGNTGIHALVKHNKQDEMVDRIAKFLKGGPDGKSPSVRIDLFGLKRISIDAATGAAAVAGAGMLSGPARPAVLAALADALSEAGVDAPLIGDAPLRPNLPTLQPGGSYLVETVVRTLNLGHHFTQGTVDSNEVWVEFAAREWTGTKGAGRLLGRSGGMSGKDEGTVDEWSHFINVLMLDRHGNRIDRRNPQDIFTPLYNHQIPPGAGQVVHYRLDLPRGLQRPVELTVRVRYRKFDYPYMELVHGKGKVPKLPIVDMCSDTVILPVAGVKVDVPAQTSPIKAAWQRWNDYGIGCFLEGGPTGTKGGELGMAEHAFARLLGDEFKAFPEAKAHGHLNLARVHFAYGGDARLELARQALEKATKAEPPAPWQTVAWLTARVNVQNRDLEAAVKNYEQILDPKNRDAKRKFDFSQDYVVRNELGMALFSLAQQSESERPARDALLKRAIGEFERVLEQDAEDISAHDFLHRCYEKLAGEKPPLALAEPRTPSEKKLLELIKPVTSSEPPPTVDDCLAVARHLGTVEAAKEKLRPDVLAVAHARCLIAAGSSHDPLFRLALAPVVTQLDKMLLETVEKLAADFRNGGLAKAERLERGRLLAEVLDRLNSRPPQEDVATLLLPLGVVPRSGLPVSLALLGAADRGHLQGPLPPPRTLPLKALRPLIHHSYAKETDPELQRTAARLLGQTHLVLHGIFRPDDNARDLVVRRYRSKHPAAARASQPIVIYELQVGR